MKEAQQSICSWGEQTFGPCSALATATRMNIEVAELLQDLSSWSVLHDPQLNALIKANNALAEAINIRTNRLEADGLLYGRPTLGAECPDILIVLYQVAERCGIDLHERVDAKMAINRAREWLYTANGFQHK